MYYYSTESARFKAYGFEGVTPSLAPSPVLPGPRTQAILKFFQFVAASPLLKADRKYSELSDELVKQANVFDFAKLAKSKLDPLAWDYLDEGSDDEVSLRANRTG